MIPEIHIVNDTPYPATIEIAQGGQVRSWRVIDEITQQIEAGEYQYRLLGPLFARTGKPDMVGVLRCRRQHSYEAGISTHVGSETSYQDFGDSY